MYYCTNYTIFKFLSLIHFEIKMAGYVKMIVSATKCDNSSN